MSFSKAGIEKAKQQAAGTGKRVRLKDEQTKGLLIVATPAGSLSFYVRREIKGQDAWEKLGEFGDKPHQLTIDQARRKAYQVLGDIQSGYNPIRERANIKGEPSLRDLFEHYIENHAKDHRKTWRVMQQDFERNLGARAVERGIRDLSSRKASDISFSDVKLMKEKLKENAGPYTANRTLQLLRAIYNSAIKLKFFKGENPAAEISLYKEETRDRYLQKHEIEQFMTALNEEPSRDTRDFIMLSLLTGARKSNIFSMRFSDVNFDAGFWTIPETKNGTSQTIALTGVEIALIKSRETGKSDFVFPGEGKSGHLTDVKRSWTKLRERAKLPDITIHDLRRNLGSWMASQNVNMALVKGALNHKDMKTTMNVYARTAKDAERGGRLQAHVAMFEAAGKAGEHLLKVVSKEMTADAKVQTNKKRTRATTR